MPIFNSEKVNCEVKCLSNLTQLSSYYSSASSTAHPPPLAIPSQLQDLLAKKEWNWTAAVSRYSLVEGITVSALSSS